MTDIQEEIEEILEKLSDAQWELGNNGLIPLSKNVNEAKQALTDLIQADVTKTVLENNQRLARLLTGFPVADGKSYLIDKKFLDKVIATLQTGGDE